MILAKKMMYLFIFAALASLVAAATVPTYISYQGKLANQSTGNAITPASIRINITDLNNFGSVVWNSTFNDIVDSQGVFNLILGKNYTLNLTAGKDYQLVALIDYGSTSFVNADVIFGDDQPLGDEIIVNAGGPSDATELVMSDNVSSVEAVFRNYTLRTGDVMNGSYNITGYVNISKDLVIGGYKINMSPFGEINATTFRGAFIGDGLGLTGVGGASPWTIGDGMLYNSTGRIGIGTTVPLVKLHIQGNGSLLNITNGTDTFLFVNSSGFVGIGISTPGHSLVVNNKVNISSAGDVNATKFYGDGTGLTGILTSAALNEINIGLTQNITDTRASIVNNITSISTILRTDITSNITAVRAEIVTNHTDLVSRMQLNWTYITNNISLAWINLTAFNTSLGLKLDRAELGAYATTAMIDDNATKLRSEISSNATDIRSSINLNRTNLLTNISSLNTTLGLKADRGESSTDGSKIANGTDANLKILNISVIRGNTTILINATEGAGNITALGFVGNIDCANVKGTADNVCADADTIFSDADLVQADIGNKTELRGNIDTNATDIRSSINLNRTNLLTNISSLNTTLGLKADRGESSTDGSKIANGTDASLKNLNVTLLNVTNNTILLGNLSVDTNVLYVDADNNNVGIGTSTPSGKLEISGGNDILTINADNTIGKVWQSFTAGGSTYGRFIVNPQGVEYSGNDAFSNPSFFFMNSSVAIGTRSADFRLDVNGTASFNETMFIQSGIVNISGNLIINNYKVNISSSGDVNATKFYGDGTGITGITATDGSKIANNTDATLNSLNVTNSMAVNSNTLYVDSATNRVGIRTSSPDFNLEIVNDGAAGSIYMTGYRPTAGNGAFIGVRSARGTEAAPTALALGDTAGTFSAQAYNGSDWQGVGRLRWHLDSNTSGLYGSTIEFMNRNGAGAEAAQMVLNENGSLGIGTESPSEDLTIGANKVNISSNGDVNATKFYGDGSELTGILTSTALNEINLGLTQNITNTRTSIDNNITKARAEISSNATDIRSSVNLNWTNLKANDTQLRTNISNLNTTLGKKVNRGETGYTSAWVSGNNILHNASINTKVGIGTINPLVKLHIQGNGSLLNITNGSNSFLFVNSSGFVGIGTSIPTNQLEISDDLGIIDHRGLTVSEHIGGIAAAVITLEKSRGTKNTPTIVNDADHIGVIFGQGYDGSEYFHGANIGFKVNGVPSAGYVPIDIIFSTKATESGADGVATGERMRITSVGKVGIGTASPASNLHVYNTTKEVKVLVDAGDGISNSSITLTAIGSPHVYGAKITFDPVNGNTYFDSLFSGTGSDIYFRTKTLGTPAVEALFIESAGAVSIGEGGLCVGTGGCTAPTTDGRLLVEGSITTGTTSDQAYNHFGAGTKDNANVADSNDVYISDDLEVDGTVYIPSTGGTAGAYWTVGDIAENIDTIESRDNQFCNGDVSCLKNATNDDIDFGDVVCINPESDKVIKKCDEPNSRLVAGVISDTAVLFVGPMDGYPVSLAGLVNAYVTNENGDIMPGDLLVTSSKPGYAMKNNEPKDGTVIGKAFDFCTEDECRIPIIVALS